MDGIEDVHAASKVYVAHLFLVLNSEPLPLTEAHLLRALSGKEFHTCQYVLVLFRYLVCIALLHISPVERV